MGYWSVVPTAVRKSKKLTAEEKELYYEIYDRLNVARYTTVTNEELAHELSIPGKTISAKTISTRINSLKEKGFLNISFKNKRHVRRIYAVIPGEPELPDPEIPTNISTYEKIRQFLDAMQKAKGKDILNAIYKNIDITVKEERTVNFKQRSYDEINIDDLWTDLSKLEL